MVTAAIPQFANNIRVNHQADRLAGAAPSRSDVGDMLVGPTRMADAGGPGAGLAGSWPGLVTGPGSYGLRVSRTLSPGISLA